MENKIEDLQDPLKLVESWELIFEQSMNFTYKTIEILGIELWVKTLSKSETSKKNILTNMLVWFEKHEEYEKCQIIKNGLNFLK